MPMAIITDMTMTDTHDLIRIQAWLSPAFPTGAFSYSSGLEAASRCGLIENTAELEEWLIDFLSIGAFWNDAVLFAEAWRSSGDAQRLAEVTELAEALCFSSTRHLEAIAQGEAFLSGAAAWGNLPILPGACVLPVAAGAVCGQHGIGLQASLGAYLHAAVSNQVQAALRLIRIGQQSGLELLVRLEPVIVETAELAAGTSLDDLGSSGLLADVMALNHETLESRIFRS